MKKDFKSNCDRKHKLIRPSEAKHYTCETVHIGDLDVLDGDEIADSAVWQWQDNEIAKAAYQELLPYPIYSHSHPAFAPDNEKYGKDYLKKGIEARYIKITDHKNMTRMLVLDNDDSNYYSWKGKLPHPNVAVISPLTLRSHVFYFLSEEVNIYSARYKALKERMSRLVGGEVDERNIGEKYRSPFFIKGLKEHSYLKDGVLQPDFHYNLIYKDTWTKLYTLDELETYLKPLSLDGMDYDDTRVSDENVAVAHSVIRPRSFTNLIISCELGLSEDKSSTNTGHRNYMWDNAYKNALKCYNPHLHVDMVKSAMRREYEIYGHSVKKHNIDEAVRYTYEWGKKKYDPSKRRQREVATKPKYDHSSQRQREVANIRYNNLRDIIGLLNVDKIKSSGKSKSTFYREKRACTGFETSGGTLPDNLLPITISPPYNNKVEFYDPVSKRVQGVSEAVSRATYYRHKKNGKPVKTSKPWETLGMKRRTYYDHLKKGKISLTNHDGDVICYAATLGEEASEASTLVEHITRSPDLTAETTIEVLPVIEPRIAQSQPMDEFTSPTKLIEAQIHIREEISPNTLETVSAVKFGSPESEIEPSIEARFETMEFNEDDYVIPSEDKHFVDYLQMSNKDLLQLFEGG